jgi:hypothetical protein
MNLIENTMYQDDIMKIITHPLPWNKLQNKALLISGATGLVGSFLIDVIMLLNREQGLNCKVYSLGRNEDKAKSRFSYCYESSLFQFISYDINLPFVRNDIGSVVYVLHLASNTHPVAYATDPIGTITTNIIGTQNPLQSESYQWKNVEANLTLDITPFVSLDSCITLQIDLSQSEFTEREVEGAPPGTTNRSFNSIIKVKNQEMVLLGGIERNLTSQTSSGLPLVARIPVLRWIFGSSSKNKKSQKLNVFIKPTIIN